MFGAHSRIVRSLDPEAITPPVLEIATESTGPCICYSVRTYIVDKKSIPHDRCIDMLVNEV